MYSRRLRCSVSPSAVKSSRVLPRIRPSASTRASSWRVESPIRPLPDRPDAIGQQVATRSRPVPHLPGIGRRVGRRSARSWRWPQRGTPAAGNFGADGDRVEQLTRGQAHASRRRAGLRPHGERRPCRRGGAAHHLGLPHRRRAGAAVRRPPRSASGSRRRERRCTASARSSTSGRRAPTAGWRRTPSASTSCTELPRIARGHGAPRATSARADDCMLSDFGPPGGESSGYSMSKAIRSLRRARRGAGCWLRTTAGASGRTPVSSSRIAWRRGRRPSSSQSARMLGRTSRWGGFARPRSGLR